MTDPDDRLPPLLADVERDVRDEALAAARPRLDALVEGALAASPLPSLRPAAKRREGVVALAATLAVATAMAAGVAVWRRTPEPRRPRAEESASPPVRVAPPEAPSPLRARAVEVEVPDAAVTAADASSTAAVVVRRPRATTPSPSPVAAREDAASLYRRANEARRARAHEEAASLYRALLASHPDAAESQQARVTLGRLQLDRGDAREAEALFGAYLARAPRGIEAETALAGRARALGRLGRGREEAAAWGALLAAYPDSAHAEEARQRVAELGAR